MLAIRLQRTGRSGHAQFRVVVQDAHLSPTSGKVVALLGSYNPHTKVTSLDKEKASFYLEHGAQPSGRVVTLLKSEGVALPKWVSESTKKEGAIRNPEKLRKNQPAEAEKPAEESETPAAETVAEEPTETPAEENAETEASDTAEDTPAA